MEVDAKFKFWTMSTACLKLVIQFVPWSVEVVAGRTKGEPISTAIELLQGSGLVVCGLGANNWLTAPEMRNQKN